jgi:methionine-gamma-lyase
VIDPETMPEIFGGIRGPEQGGCFLYSRHFNPTVDILARYLSAMEGTEFAVCTASGMSAISCTLLQLCKNGDHIVSSDTIYGGTHALLEDLLPQFGIPPPLWTPPIRPLLKKRSHRKPVCFIPKPWATPP